MNDRFIMCVSFVICDAIVDLNQDRRYRHNFASVRLPIMRVIFSRAVAVWNEEASLLRFTFS
jgi:hypothetical protein